MSSLAKQTQTQTCVNTFEKTKDIGFMCIVGIARCMSKNPVPSRRQRAGTRLQSKAATSDIWKAWYTRRFEPGRDTQVWKWFASDRNDGLPHAFKAARIPQATQPIHALNAINNIDSKGKGLFDLDTSTACQQCHSPSERSIVRGTGFFDLDTSMACQQCHTPSESLDSNKDLQSLIRNGKAK